MKLSFIYSIINACLINLSWSRLFLKLLRLSKLVYVGATKSFTQQRFLGWEPSGNAMLQSVWTHQSQSKNLESADVLVIHCPAGGKASAHDFSTWTRPCSLWRPGSILNLQRSREVPLNAVSDRRQLRLPPMTLLLGTFSFHLPLPAVAVKELWEMTQSLVQS